MRFLLFPLVFASATIAHAAPPQLLLEVARFRNLDQVQKGGEVEISVTVPTQPLTYRQRAPKSFQSSAVVELDILKADGTSAWHETVTLKPPVLNDTTSSIEIDYRQNWMHRHFRTLQTAYNSSPIRNLSD